MKVLVTGGDGFIGSHVAARLVADGHEVRILDNFTTGRRSNLDAVGADVERIEGDMRSSERTSTAVGGCEVVLHQGAMSSVPRSINDPLTTYDVNVGGTLNILLAELRDIIGTDVEPEYVDPRPGEVRHSQADISLARELIGYEPQVDLREGLRRTVAHYAELASTEAPAAG